MLEIKLIQYHKHSRLRFFQLDNEKLFFPSKVHDHIGYNSFKRSIIITIMLIKLLCMKERDREMLRRKKGEETIKTKTAEIH